MQKAFGRAWQLLTGERAHYELAAGRPGEAVRLLRALGAFASDGGMLPEQVWDGPDVPERELFCGRPTDSAMPLVWAHAEYIKLRRSLREGRVFDMPLRTVERYQRDRQGAAHAVWRLNQKCRVMAVAQTLRVELLAPAVVHWSADGWQTVRQTPTRDTGLGMHSADLTAAERGAPGRVDFTLFWTQPGEWLGRDFCVCSE